MKITDFAKEIVAKNHFIKASFGGFAGSGKSRTATEFIVGSYHDMKCTKPILAIDNEKGSRFFIPFFKKELPDTKVFVKDTVHLADVVSAMELLNSGEIDFLLVDSLSKVWYQYVSDYRAKNNIRFMTLQDWGKILPSWQQEFSDKFVNINGSIVFTGRGGFTYEKEEDEKNEDGSTKKKGAFVKSGVKMKMAGETPFEPDINVWMEQQQEMTEKGLSVWREAQIMKDRSNMIDGKTFRNPTYSDFAPVIAFLMNLPTGEVAGATSTQNLAPSENFEGYEKRQSREIALEKIKAEFEKMGLGTGKEDKQLKVLIFEKIFKTTAWAELERRDANMLAADLLELIEFFQLFNQAKDKLQFTKEYKIKGEINL